ncbi:hypothetical protein KC316_g65 [Hortaea werneckii]|nr:hypothetical protein KC316_g65 [Hortaea werneckii]
MVPLAPLPLRRGDLPIPPLLTRPPAITTGSTRRTGIIAFVPRAALAKRLALLAFLLLRNALGMPLLPLFGIRIGTGSSCTLDLG